MSVITPLIEDVAVKWANHVQEEVREIAEVVQTLHEAVDKGIGAVTVDLGKVLSGSNTVLKRSLLSEETPDLYWHPFPHAHPDVSPGVLVAHLAEPSEQGVLDLIFIPAGQSIPQHGVQAATVFEVVSGAKGSQIGATDDTLRSVVEDEILYFPPAAPKVFRAGADIPLLLLGAQRGPLDTKFWYANPESQLDKFNDVMAIDNIHEYYLRFADQYEEVMRAWGYCMPEVTAEAILKRGMLFKADIKEAEVLDLGCGDGLTAQALTRKGFVNITGVDFSQNMLKKSEERGCYKALKQADLLKELPFKDESFDLLVSTAVTTYINPSVLPEWIRICKSGGVIVFTHKTLIWKEWEEMQDKLEAEEKLWSKEWISQPIPYLPSLKEGGTKTCTEDAKIYIYRKL